MDRTPLVLIVEDSPSMMEQIVKILNLSGYRTRQAGYAMQAVGVARKERPDLILTDVGLPDMDGATAASLLRDDPAFSDVPVVLMSALSREELQERMAETGAVDLLPKPFSPGDLVRCIRHWISAA
jgi:CheY-like chemotaxis protein